MMPVTADVAVIGAGVIGCAVARRATLDGARVVVLEAGHDILSGASKGNSAILHTGFDAPEGSRELTLMRAGREEFLEARAQLGLPLLETGAMVIGWTPDDADRLDGIAAKGRSNGVGGLAMLTAREIRAREPALAPASGGLWVGGEHVIDPWSTPLAYLRQAVANGAVVLTSARVNGGAFDGTGWRLDTERGPVATEWVVNCAGLYSDVVDHMLSGQRRFVIRPRKGQFVVFDKAAAPLLHTIILAVPTEYSKGVVLCPTIFGNLMVGPTAEEQEDRERTAVDEGTLSLLRAVAARAVPALARMPVTAVYAGLRPASDENGYRLFTDSHRHLVTVGGIRSTGLTSALGIASHVSAEIGLRMSHEPLPAPAAPSLPNLAEHLPRDWQRGDRGEIVCHCEMVTRHEIVRALDGPLPARDMGGLRRRTRAMMGRCQGFYCSARIASLTGARLDPPLSVDAT